MSGQGVHVLTDTASPMIRRLRAGLQVAGMAAVVGRAERNLVREHLFDLNKAKHRPGGRNFYAQAARGTTASTSHHRVTISINQEGFAQRLHGGVIKPRRGKFLTIADPGMPGYGKRAAEFNDIEFGRTIDPETGRMRRALIRRPSTALRYRRRRQADGSLKTYVRPGEVRMREPVFWLVRSVNQKPNRDVLPSDREFIGTATAAIDKRLQRLTRRDSR